MIFEREGDVFDCEHQAYAHGVNSLGRMNAGIAVRFRQLYPQMYREYKKLCYSKKLSKRERFLSPDEFGRLSDVLNELERTGKEMPSVIAAIRLLIATGARMSEILTLRWDWVNLERRRLELPDSKTGAKFIHLNGLAMEILSAIDRDPENPHVISGGKSGQHLVNKSELARVLCVSVKTLGAMIDRYGGEFPITKTGSHGVDYEFRIHDVVLFLARKAAEVRQATCLQAKMVEELAIGPVSNGASELSVLSGHQKLALAKARLAQRELERFEGRLVQRDDLIETMEIVLGVLLCQIDALLDDLTRRFDLVGEKEKYVREQVEDILLRMADIFFERLGLKFAFLETRLGRTGE